MRERERGGVGGREGEEERDREHIDVREKHHRLPSLRVGCAWNDAPTNWETWPEHEFILN